jgi:hypothetical protein
MAEPLATRPPSLVPLAAQLRRGMLRARGTQPVELAVTLTPEQADLLLALVEDHSPLPRDDFSTDPRLWSWSKLSAERHGWPAARAEWERRSRHLWSK